MYTCTNKTLRMDGWMMDGWMDGLDGWMGWMDGWMDEWMDVQTWDQVCWYL